MAAANAASTSSAPDTGASKFSSPVDGSTNFSDMPDLGAIDEPPMKFDRLVVVNVPPEDLV